MTANFEIEESIALRFEGKYLDLHNCYDFIGFHYHNAARQILLTFSKVAADWVKNEDPQKLTITHYDVTFLDIKYINTSHEFPDDDKCLADLTFFPSDDRKTNDRIVVQTQPKNDDDVIYIFQSDYYIRIGCNKIELFADT